MTEIFLSCTEIKNIEQLKSHPLIGCIMESFVFSELYKSFSHIGEQPLIYGGRQCMQREGIQMVPWYGIS